MEKKISKNCFFPWIHSNKDENIKFLKKFKREHIVFLDYCPKKEYLTSENKYLIIDHHHDAINSLYEADNIKMYCDTNRAACMLVWDYLYPNTKYPISLYHIGSADLFDFSNVNTEPFNIAYKLFNLTYDSLINLNINNNTYKNIILYGNKQILKYQYESIQYFYTSKIIKETINDKKYTILCIMCDKYNLYKYLINNAKLNFPNCNILRIQKNMIGKISYSLRSLDGTNVDEIARFYGGNGHKLAAGYTI